MEPDAVRRELLALLNASGTSGGADDNGRSVRRPSNTPAVAAAASESPGARAKPAKKK
jgi:hypothetical protein